MMVDQLPALYRKLKRLRRYLDEPMNVPQTPARVQYRKTYTEAVDNIISIIEEEFYVEEEE